MARYRGAYCGWLLWYWTRSYRGAQQRFTKHLTQYPLSLVVGVICFPANHPFQGRQVDFIHHGSPSCRQCPADSARNIFGFDIVVGVSTRLKFKRIKKFRSHHTGIDDRDPYICRSTLVPQCLGESPPHIGHRTVQLQTPSEPRRHPRWF